MDSPTIEDLPMEIYFKILDYIPQKLPFRLASKKLYEATWKYELRHFWLCLTKQDFLDQQNGENNKIAILLRTKREIQNLSILCSTRSLDSYEMSLLTRIFKKFGAKIKKLKLTISLPKGSGSPERLISLLMQIPNVEELHLNIYSVDILTKWNPVNFSKSDLKQSYLKFHCLKHLTVKLDSHYCTNQPGTGLDWFRSLFLGFITQDSRDNIKELNSSFSRSDVNFLKSVQLEEIVFDPYKHILISEDENQYFIEIMNKKNLKRLELKVRVSESQLASLVDSNKKLQAFAFEALSISPKGIQVISFLSDLKELQIKYIKEDTCKSLSEMENSRLLKMYIGVYRHEKKWEDLGIIKKLARSAPNLKELIFCSYNFEQVHAVLLNFRLLESLQLDGSFYRNNYELVYDDRDYLNTDCSNEKLKRLKIEIELKNCIRFTEKLMKDFPNLEEISFNNKLRYNYSNPVRDLRLTLKGWKKLLYLVWKGEGGTDLIKNDLDLILDHGHNIKFIYLQKTNIYDEDDQQEVREMFFERFPIIQFFESRENEKGNFENHPCLLMAENHEILAHGLALAKGQYEK